MNHVEGKPGWTWRNSVDGRVVVLDGPDGQVVTLRLEPVGFTVEAGGTRRWVPGPFWSALPAAVQIAKEATRV